MNEKFLKPYNSLETEDRIIKKWEESGYQNPDNLPVGAGKDGRFQKPFSIVLPPPNVTGTLHLGHAFEDTIQDIVVRYKRMKGFKTLWIPGTDHAAIATQAKVEKDIVKKEGKSRHDLGRVEFLKRVDSFAQESHDTIVGQIKKMGASVDWSREAFTLDEKRSLAVRTAFKKMYDEGLIYRGFRVINWDPKGQTTISDDEIVYEPRKAKLYTFKYSQDIPISISTTRPETKLGDVAIAVHPDDSRYKKYIGKEYDAIFAGQKIHLKVIADEAVEKDFGTGALGVTPAHSSIDFEMAERHKLPLNQIIDEYGKMTVGNEGIKGKKVAEAREAVVAWLREQNLLQSEQEIDQNIATAERTGGIIEPLPKLQWFVAVNKKFKKKDKNGKEIETSLKELMEKSVISGEISIMPDHFEKIYFNWIKNLKDWCISRQIWYGHRIPVWYKENGEIYCDIEAPKDPPGQWKQEEDTLDTWFSSGLWTFSTLGWPEKTKDLETFHPTTFLCPGYEILFFWVARMILMSQFLLDEAPFRTVYLHGIVRDSKGKKFSKSAGNGIEPLEIISKYGTDALRMALVIGVGPGNDTKFDEAKVKGYRSFGNKIWNISRFIFSAKENFKLNFDSTYDAAFSRWASHDQVLVENLESLAKEVTKEMDEYKFYLVGEKLYHYAWHEFADKIIEESKTIFAGSDDEAKKSRMQFLMWAHRQILKLLHPFMPFITEEIWGELEGGKQRLLMVEEWGL